MEDLSLGIILAQIINFWIVFFVFKHFLWDKIVKIITDRRELLKSLKDADALTKQKLAEADKLSENIINESKQKALEIQNNALELSKKQTQNKLDEAEVKAKNILDWALRDLKKQELEMIEWLKWKMLDISLKVNAKILHQKDPNKEFIQNEINWVKL